MEWKIVIISFLLGFCHGEEDRSYLFYPCGTDCIDISCVRNFFLNTGQCTAASHSDGEPIYMAHQYAYMPSFDLSTDSTDCEVTYYGSRIVSFYLNTISNRLVLAVDFSGIGLYSPLVRIKLARNELEPVEFQDYGNVTYAATLTAYVPWCPGISLKDLSVSALITKPSPEFDLGPNIAQSQDPEVQRVVQQFNANKATSVKEMFLTKAYYFFFGFFQNYICDYGYQYSGAINK